MPSIRYTAGRPRAEKLTGDAMARKRVVLTDAAGYIAQRMLSALRERFDLVMLDAIDKARSGQAVPGAAPGRPHEARSRPVSAALPRRRRRDPLRVHETRRRRQLDGHVRRAIPLVRGLPEVNRKSGSC